MPEPKKTKFETQCEKIASENDVTVMFFCTGTNQDPTEDDGNLHVSRRRKRACFCIGQDEKVSIYNQKTEAILTELGLEKFIGPRVLVGDDCPHGCDEQGCQGECGCQKCGETHECCTCQDEEESTAE